MRSNVSAKPTELEILDDLRKKVLWLSVWMIHHANHIRPSTDGLKVGGHQASCSSLVSVMTALYFSVLRARDRVAVKPHASPVFHAIQYLLGNQTRENLESFRAFGGAQSYPSRTKDVDDVDFSTGSVGLGAAITCFTSVVQDYLDKKIRKVANSSRIVALVGDAELDEGNVFEALLEGYKYGLRNTWWIIDYNRQSLDGVIREGLHQRFTEIFESLGWQVIRLKYGARLRAVFERAGGEALKTWIDECPNQLYSALTYQGGDAWRRRLRHDLGHLDATSGLIDSYTDDELAELMTDLGGHCLETLIEAFNGINHDNPVCFITYTVKGWGLPIAGHKDNHAGLLSPAQVEELRCALDILPGKEWELFSGLKINPVDLSRYLKSVPFNSEGARQFASDMVEVPNRLDVPKDRYLSTQEGFGKILFDIAGSDTAFANRIVTTSPDVTVSTNLGGWVNRRGLFGVKAIDDTFKTEKVASVQKWKVRSDGQHLELGIAENNLFLLLAALGLSHAHFGERLLPIGTVYDPFIQRGLDALNYACYQDARFILVATPSGISLAPEGGAHQSVGTPLIGMAQDGLACFEPSFVDELAVILRWAFEYVQRDGDAPGDKEDSPGDRHGGSVYLRLSTRKLEQPLRTIDRDLQSDIIKGGYWLRPPGPSCTTVIVYTGVVASEAIEAAGRMGDWNNGVGVLCVTSADRLNAGWSTATVARHGGAPSRPSHVENLLSQVPKDAHLITVLDGHPTTLSWLGSVFGHRVLPLGVRHFGQSGNVADLYRHHRIDSDAIVAAAKAGRAAFPDRFSRMIA